MKAVDVTTDNNTKGIGKSGSVAGGNGKSPKIPDATVPFSEKLQDSYGLSIAQLISSHWFGSGGTITSGNFMNRREHIRRKRLDFRGEGDLSYYKDNFKQGDNDLDFINIDWTKLNWGGKFCWIVINGISDKNYEVTARSTNRLALIEKEKTRDYYMKHMASRAMFQKHMALKGENLMPPGIPEDQEELDIKMKTNPRSSIEIVEQLLIKYVLNTNRWDFISHRLNIDNVTAGLMAARVWLDKNNGIQVAYTDIENYVHSRIESNDFDKKYYEGVIETITISDLRRESGWDDDTLKIISKQAGPMPGINYDYCTLDDIVDQQVHILRFAYKTSKRMVYEKKTRKGETIKMNRRDEYSDVSKSNKAEKILDTWLEGNFVIGTKYIYDYKECENLFDDVMNKCRSPYIVMAHGMYENRLSAFTDNIEGPARQLQKISLKIQQLVNKLRPSPINIDLDALAELDDGKGGVKEELWKNALSIFNVEGVSFSQRKNLGELGIIEGPAIKTFTQGSDNALERLLNVWAQYYNMIRENTGINPARDGSAPADTLVGLNQMAQLASNTVTKNIVDNAQQFKKQVCEVISSRLHAIFRYKDAEHLRKLYENVVGKEFLDAMEILKDRHLHEFGFILDTVPTIEVLQEFKEDLSIAVQGGFIDVDVKATAQDIARTDVKLARQYLAFQIKKSKQKQMEEKMQLIQQQTQGNMQSAQATEQAKSQSYQTKVQVDLQYQSQMAQIEIMKEQALQQIRQPIADQEFKQEVYLEQIKANAKLSNENFKEDRKDDRTELQASQQSTLIDQRLKNKPPVDFKSTDAWFKGLEI